MLTVSVLRSLCLSCLSVFVLLCKVVKDMHRLDPQVSLTLLLCDSIVQSESQFSDLCPQSSQEERALARREEREKESSPTRERKPGRSR